MIYYNKDSEVNTDSGNLEDKTVKKVLSVLLAFLFLFSTFQLSAAGSVYKVSVDINFIGNLIFSKYDVDLYLNDLQLERLPHGRDYSGSFYAEEGYNTLLFYKEDNNSVNGRIDFEVTGNTSIKCTISCYSDNVSVSDVKIETETPPAVEPIPEPKITETPTAEPAPEVTDVPTAEPTPEATEIPTAVPEPEQEAIEKINTEPAPVITEAPVTEPNPEVSRQVSFAEIDLTLMSDDELASALEAIVAEQKARIKTKIMLDKTSIVVPFGKTDKISAEITELPEGETIPKLTWESSDKKVATCSDGTVKAVKDGTAIITCSGTLSNGTIITGECAVQVIVPIATIIPKPKTINMKGGEKVTPEFSFKPANATITILEFESSNADVASVNAEGMIEGTGAGNATITAKATDGSGKTATINVKVVDKRIPVEKAKKAVLVGICNDRSDDILKADGSYDKSKFHDYNDARYMITIVDNGSWTTPDGGNSWHVSDLIAQVNGWNGFHKYSFDIIFDGKSYKLENGIWVSAAQMKYLNGPDASKYSDEIPLEPAYFPYLIVSPNQIGD